MKLVEMTTTGYLDILKSEAPAPGGGSVSALAGTQAAGLVSMVCDLSIGKPKYADFEEELKEAKEESLKLYAELFDNIDKDTEAFNMVAAAYKMPKDTDELKAERSKAIRAANLVATEVPFRTVELCLMGLKNMKRILGKFNTNAASDYGVAALNFIAGAQGAWLNVKINLPGVKDEERKAAFMKAEDMMKEAVQLGGEIYTAIEASL